MGNECTNCMSENKENEIVISSDTELRSIQIPAAKKFGQDLQAISYPERNINDYIDSISYRVKSIDRLKILLNEVLLLFIKLENQMRIVFNVKCNKENLRDFEDVVVGVDQIRVEDIEENSKLHNQVVTEVSKYILEYYHQRVVWGGISRFFVFDLKIGEKDQIPNMDVNVLQIKRNMKEVPNKQSIVVETHDYLNGIYSSAISMK